MNVKDMDKLLRKEQELVYNIRRLKFKMERKQKKAKELYERLVKLGVQKQHHGPSKTSLGVRELLSDNRFSNVLSKLLRSI